MRRVEPHQQRFSQKTEQVTARRLIRDWDFIFFPNSIAVGTRSLQQCFLDRGRFSSRLSMRDPAARGTRVVYQRAVAAGGTTAAEGGVTTAQNKDADRMTCSACCGHTTVRTHAFSIPRRRWSSCHPSVTHGRLTKFHRLSHRGRFRSYR